MEPKKIPIYQEKELTIEDLGLNKEYKFQKYEKQKKQIFQNSYQNGLSDATLLLLFRKAVKKLWGFKCAYPECKNIIKPYKLEAHHIIRRAKKIGRYDPYNGILCCKEHHNFFHFQDSKPMLIDLINNHPEKNYSWEHIEQIDLIYDLKKYLQENMITEKEFLNNQKKLLQEIINGI